MKILLTNDDGILALGINVLAQVLCKDYDCFMVAPSKNCSACSHSLTIHTEYEYEYVDGLPCKAVRVYGTPADCVKLALLHLNYKPDIVISGINNGSNLGTDIVYSGTVSAATEASILGYKAIAVSLNKWNCAEDKYVATAEFISKRLPEICSANFGLNTVLNINYPADVAYKGVKVTKAGINLYSDGFVESKSKRVRLVGEPITHSLNDDDCDVELIKKGYATITPILIDRNDYSVIEQLKKSNVFKN